MATGKYGRIDCEDLSDFGSVEVPVKVDDNGVEHSIIFYAGALVCNYDKTTNRIAPSYDWAMIEVPKDAAKKTTTNAANWCGTVYKEPKYEGPEEVTFPDIHTHTLYYMDNFHNHQCDVCKTNWLKCSYRCATCDFDYCLNCYRKKTAPYTGPQEHNNPKVHQHPLKYTDTPDERTCNVCQSAFHRQTYQCTECKFNYCLGCHQTNREPLPPVPENIKAILYRIFKVTPQVVEEFMALDDDEIAQAAVCQKHKVNLQKLFELKEILLSIRSYPPFGDQFLALEAHVFPTLHEHPVALNVTDDVDESSETVTCSKCLKEDVVRYYQCQTCPFVVCLDCFSKGTDSLLDQNIQAAAAQVCQPYGVDPAILVAFINEKDLAKRQKMSEDVAMMLDTNIIGLVQLSLKLRTLLQKDPLIMGATIARAERSRKREASYDETRRVRFIQVHEHDLIFNNGLVNHYCNLCNTQDLTKSYRCSQCDFDCCLNCVQKLVSGNTE